MAQSVNQVASEIRDATARDFLKDYSLKGDSQAELRNLTVLVTTDSPAMS